MVSRKVADPIAFTIAIVTLIAGLVLVVGKGPSFDPPTKTTTVVESGSGTGLRKRTTTTEVNKPVEKKKGGHKTTKQVEVPVGAPSSKRTETVENSSRSFVERALGESGLILLQLAVILLASFMAGAFTQRVLVGEFALKVGGIFELDTMQEEAEETIEGLTAKSPR